MVTFDGSRPDSDCFELSVFGAGVGEALALHLGDGDWMLVDSCVQPSSGKPAALAYLESIDVPPSAVSAVLITHWHQDHVAGIEKVVERCANATVFMPSAFKSRDLYLLTKAGAELETLGTEALKTSASYSKAIDVLKRNSRQANLALMDLVVRAKSVERIGSVRITALSPSQEATLISIRQFADYVANDLPARRRPVGFNPNHSAVALWLEWGEARVALGADLVNDTNEQLGWKAALKSQVLSADGVKARIIKIAHHGSENGHSPEFWRRYVEAEHGSMTTYAAGSSPPPQPGDVARLKPLCRVLCCAPRPQPLRQLKGKAVAKFAASQGIKITRRTPRFGHTRVRLHASGSVEQDCFADAAML